MPEYKDESGVVRQPASEIASFDWGLSRPHSIESITGAGAVTSAQALLRIERILKRIESLILTLGSDGLHVILRHEAGRIHRAERLKRIRATKKRRATLARKKAAAARG